MYRGVLGRIPGQRRLFRNPGRVSGVQHKNTGSLAGTRSHPALQDVNIKESGDGGLGAPYSTFTTTRAL